MDYQAVLSRLVLKEAIAGLQKDVGDRGSKNRQTAKGEVGVRGMSRCFVTYGKSIVDDRSVCNDT